MKLAEILKILDTISPLALAESWDNVGLQIGDLNSEIKNIVVSLECDSFVLDSIEDGTLVISHHPLIFKPLKSINYANFPANIVQKAIKRDISIVAMHTNFDKTHLNSAFAKRLGFDSTVQDGFLCKEEVDVKFDDLVSQIKKTLKLDTINFIAPKTNDIKTVAFCCGSGGDLIDKINADVFITGDIKYHQAMLATELGLGVIDATHFASENHFAPLMQELLWQNGLDSKMLNSKNPFTEN